MLRLAHYLRGKHGPLARHPLGGYRCECGAPISDLHEAGLLDGSHVPAIRRVFSRDRQEVTRTDSWTQNKRGEW
jgi:hypothetical protein